jgi:hypothetical protein
MWTANLERLGKATIRDSVTGSTFVQKFNDANQAASHLLGHGLLDTKQEKQRQENLNSPDMNVRVELRPNVTTDKIVLAGFRRTSRARI